MNADPSNQERKAAPGRCGGGATSSHLALPVMEGRPPRKIRKSAMGPRRAAVLIGIHVLMIAHFAHYVVADRTLSPVEPSETMYTLELGQLNAGFIFFAAALLATLIFGRFVCGWGCHLVAYQDLCGWIMKKLNVRPKPFRSRLLIFAPLGLALYMFVWPTVKRLALPGSHAAFPGFSNHLLTESFWKTFPGPVFAILTILVCGFAAVYFLGAKGFCTYGCPYGGFFGLVDQVSVGKILVNDACEQCGHCTATCTSNVRVHEEVKLYGMVVDPGCMKCLDCVSVCPNHALRFGFSKPTAVKGAPRAASSPRRFDFTLGEEIVLALVFLAATLSFRGLYDGPPLLMAVCLGGITGYLAIKLYRVARDPTVRIQNLRIKTAGSMGKSGWVFSAAACVWLIFTAHSGFVQWHRARGAYHLNRTEVTEADVFSGAAGKKEYSADHADHEAACFRAFSIADRWGLVDTVEVKRGLAWIHLLNDRDAQAERCLREAIAAAQHPEPLRADLAKVLAKQGRWEEAEGIESVDAKVGLAWVRMLRGEPAEAERLLHQAIAIDPERPRSYEELAKATAAQGKWAAAIEAMNGLFHRRSPTTAEEFQLAGLLVNANRPHEAIERYRACIRKEPGGAPAYYNLGGLLGRMGRYDEAIELLLRADELDPDDVDTQMELGLAHASAGRIPQAIGYFQRAIELAPDNPEPRMHLKLLLQNMHGRASEPRP